MTKTMSCPQFVWENPPASCKVLAHVLQLYGTALLASPVCSNSMQARLLEDVFKGQTQAVCQHMGGDTRLGSETEKIILGSLCMEGTPQSQSTWVLQEANWFSSV